jgi:hypothetical protein
MTLSYRTFRAMRGVYGTGGKLIEPTAAHNNYWSSTTFAVADLAWFVYFGNGSVNGNGESAYSYVRAVRGGV